MKVRIKGNFVRYRLSKSEVELLSTCGVIDEKTFFKNNQLFSYSLQSKDGISNLDADFINGHITIYIPTEDAKSWVNNNKVGYRHTIEIDEKNILVLLIEKDFQCLDETIEDQSDNYPNPIAP